MHARKFYIFYQILYILSPVMKARSLQMTDFINPTDATERVFNIATFRKSINQFNRHFVDISWTFSRGSP